MPPRLSGADCRQAELRDLADASGPVAGGAAAASCRSYVGLDVVRFAAALLVALFHLSAKNWGADRPFPEIDWLTSAGWVGVPIFFVISGFVISMSATGKSARDFVIGRARRLYPAAWLCATITMLIAPVPLNRYLNSLTLAPWGPWVSGVYWTLGVEIIFYAVMAVVIARAWSLTKMALFLGWASIAYYGLRAVNVLIGKPLDFAVLDANGIVLTLLPSGIYFGLGMLLFLKVHRLSALAFAVAGIGSAYRSAGELGMVASPLVAALLVTGGLLAIALFIWRDLPMNRRVARYLGLATYPFYLLHEAVGTVLMQGLGVGWPSLLIALTAIFAVSLAVLKGEDLIRAALDRIPSLWRSPSASRLAGS